MAFKPPVQSAITGIVSALATAGLITLGQLLIGSSGLAIQGATSSTLKMLSTAAASTKGVGSCLQLTAGDNASSTLYISVLTKSGTLQMVTSTASCL